MNEQALEAYYEHAILAQYGDVIVYPIKWKDHGRVDLDASAHYFDDAEGHEYILLYEDFPDGSFLKDGLSHEIVKVDGETSLQISSSNDILVENIFGYFTLYKEK